MLYFAGRRRKGEYGHGAGISRITSASAETGRDVDLLGVVADAGRGAERRHGMGGGLRRGHLSEVGGPRSSGGTAVVASCLASAIARGEVVALIDTHDRFDPVSAAAAGVDLSRLLWVRETGHA